MLHPRSCRGGLRLGKQIFCYGDGGCAKLGAGQSLKILVRAAFTKNPPFFGIEHGHSRPLKQAGKNSQQLNSGGRHAVDKGGRHNSS